MTTQTTESPKTTPRWQSGSSRGAFLRNWFTHPFTIQEPAVAALSQTFIGLLLVADLTLMFLHIIFWYTDILSSDYFSVSRERGYGEFFQYIKYLWLVSLFTLYALKSRQVTYLFWSLIFGYILIDDASAIHEKIGNFIRLEYAIPAQLGLRGADLGELIFYVLALGIFTLLLGIAFYFGTASFRRDSIYLFGLLLLFAFFASAVDVVHMLVRETVFFRLVDVVEDGGEMMVMSVIVWYVFLMFARGLQKSFNQVT